MIKINHATPIFIIQIDQINSIIKIKLFDLQFEI